MSVPLSLENFGKRVKKEARTALTKKDKNASKELYDSISYKFEQFKNSFHLNLLHFLMLREWYLHFNKRTGLKSVDTR